MKLIDGKGNGKEYDHYGKFIFEGQYLNGNRYYGKQYNDNGKLEFEGKYKRGFEWNGNIKDF